MASFQSLLAYSHMEKKVCSKQFGRWTEKK